MKALERPDGANGAATAAPGPGADEPAAQIVVLAQWIGEPAAIDSALGLAAAGASSCALCSRDVEPGHGLTLRTVPDPAGILPRLALHHRCAGLVAGAIDRQYGTMARRAEDAMARAAQAAGGVGHA